MNCSTCPEFNQSISHPACNAFEVMLGVDPDWKIIRCKECVDIEQKPQGEEDE